jgi:hypothetical protein
MRYKGCKCLLCAIHFFGMELTAPCDGCHYENREERKALVETIRPISIYLKLIESYFRCLHDEI